MAVAPDLSGCALDGRYELHSLIGEGAFGRVYRGRDLRLSRPVAVKVIKPWWSEDPQWARRFEREAQLLARLDDPGIVRIFDVGHAPEGVYYVAELVEGESLAERLRAGAVPTGDARDIAEQLCRALAQAHAEGIVHRDVKPGNVLISARGRVKVGDFGLALAPDASTGGGSGTIVGTPRYMAPEQARGGNVTPATDVYSAGVVLYEMLAGRPPFTGGSPVELAMRHVQEPPPPLPSEAPSPLRAIVGRALAKEPSERYSDGGAMADALAAATRAAGVSAATPRAATPPARNAAATLVAARLTPRRNFDLAARRRATALLAGAVVLLIGMGAAAIAIGRDPQVRVPALSGLTRAAAASRAAAVGLHPVFTARYDRSYGNGVAIGQAPAARMQVGRGSTVRVILSAGPPPVQLPGLTGESVADARATLHSLGLKVSVSQVIAPDQTPQTITAQSPRAGASLLPGATVSLAAVEWPSWRPLMRVAGDSTSRSFSFLIRGSRWRLVYDASNQGVCSWLTIFCSPPSASVVQSGGSALGTFDLNGGSGQTETFGSGPGEYQVSVAPGDNARWSMLVEDDY